MDLMEMAIEKQIKENGEYKVIFDESKLSSGTYFYKLSIKPPNGGKEIIQLKAMQVEK
jgi:hypothetical protein